MTKNRHATRAFGRGLDQLLVVDDGRRHDVATRRAWARRRFDSLTAAACATLPAAVFGPVDRPPCSGSVPTCAHASARLCYKRRRAGRVGGTVAPLSISVGVARGEGTMGSGTNRRRFLAGTAGLAAAGLLGGTRHGSLGPDL